jgi:inosose dehydratase
VPGDPEGSIDVRPIQDVVAESDFEAWLVVEAEEDRAKGSPLEYAKMAHAHLREGTGP